MAANDAAPQETAVYVINLAHRVDRKRTMESELARVGWSADFFPGVRPADPGGFPSIGARGCFLSHLAVLKLGWSSGCERIVILEDDVRFASNFRDHWERIGHLLVQRKWSILYAGHMLKLDHEGLNLIAADTSVSLAHFMMFNRTIVPTLINCLHSIESRPPGHPMGGPMHVDGAYSTIREQNSDIVTYAYAPSLAHQRPSRTDIGKTKWFDNIPIISDIVEATRRIRGRFETS